MPKRSRKRRDDDFNVVAFEVVKKATEATPNESPRAKLPRAKPTKSEISRVMAAMGRKGGKIGGKARLHRMSQERRSEIAYLAARARWEKAKKQKP